MDLLKVLGKNICIKYAKKINTCLQHNEQIQISEKNIKFTINK